jgi:hypothetical protein
MSYVMHRPVDGHGSVGSQTATASGLTLDSFSDRTPTTSATEHGQVGVPLTGLLDAFDDALNAAAEGGEQSAPTVDGFREAYALLKALPAGMIPPEAVVEPSGAIAWMWDQPAIGFLVLAVDGSGQFEYSAVLGGVEAHGKVALLDYLQPEVQALVAQFHEVNA